MAPQKFYAILNGRDTGIVNSWNECKSSVSGYSNAEFKSFSTQAEANAYLSRKSSSGNSSSNRSSGSLSSYGDCETSTSHLYYSGPSRSASASASASAPKYTSAANVSKSGYSPFNRRSSRNMTSSSDSKSRHHNNLNWHKFDSKDFEKCKSNTERVFTDGSSLGNGKTGSKAGYGVYWGKEDSRNIGRPVATGDQTNNHGELLAVNHALDQIKSQVGNGSKKDYEIYSDSQYVCKSITEYPRTWDKNGWKTASSQPVKHQELIKEINSKINDVLDKGVNIDIKHIPAHVGHEGNEMADFYAKQGASRST